MHHRDMTSESVLSGAERRFLEEARTATLATRSPDGGSARLVPICFVVLDLAAGPCLVTPLDEKPKRVADPRDLERVRDIGARPDVDLLVDRWSEDWSDLAWLRIGGRAGLLDAGHPDHAAAVPRLRAKYPQYESHRLEDRPAIRIDVLRARSWGRLDP
jgi:PPOX class probable F420-dependent enzyme